MKKILIINHDCLLNKGDESIIEGMTYTIKKYIPNSKLLIHSFNYEIDRSRTSFNIKPGIKAAYLSIRKSQHALRTMIYFLICFVWRFFSLFKVNFDSILPIRLRDYRESDIIIVRGADCITEDYGLPYLLANLTTIAYAILLKKSVVVYASSIGPFKKKYIKFISKMVLNNTSLITVRENFSKNILEEIGVNKPKIEVTADAAFAFNPVTRISARKIIIREAGNHLKRKIIGISPSQLISGYSDGLSYEKYVETMSELGDWLCHKYDSTVLLIPHVFGPVKATDDRIIIRQVFSKVKNKACIVPIEKEYSARELRGIIGLCSIFVGARMHANISALSMSVPTLAISYSLKTQGIMDMFEQGEWVIDIKKLTLNELKYKISKLWKNKKKIRRDLMKKSKIIRQKSLYNGQLIKDVLEKPS
jgi:colanic acid/amylovoran biosynthesis protein